EQNSGVYIQPGTTYSEPMTAQHNFANTYDLSHPQQAMSSYSKVMLQHTQRQLQTATSSARRRSQGSSTTE
ncbi:hypothetical protein BDY21DRAFT_267954, partial [Lineolata rhizophorae]